MALTIDFGIDFSSVNESMTRLRDAFEGFQPLLRRGHWRPSRRMKRMAVKQDRYWRRCDRITGGRQAGAHVWPHRPWHVDCGIHL